MTYGIRWRCNFENHAIVIAFIVFGNVKHNKICLSSPSHYGVRILKINQARRHSNTTIKCLFSLDLARRFYDEWLEFNIKNTFFSTSRIQSHKKCNIEEGLKFFLDDSWCALTNILSLCLPCYDHTLKHKLVHFSSSRRNEHLLHQNLAMKEYFCLLYTSPSPRDKRQSRMPSSAWKKKK